MSEQLEASASALAAFTLAQFTVFALLDSGLWRKNDAEKLLKLGIEANARGGPANQLAAAKLRLVLEAVQKYAPPQRQ